MEFDVALEDLRAYNLVSESINCGFGIGKSELYLRIELLGSDKYVKTNGISSSEPEWEEKLILYDVEEDGVLEFVLKRRRPGWRPVVIGRAQRKIFELISFTSGYHVLAIYDEEHRCIGNIEVSVTCSHINRISVVYSQLDARLDLNPHADHEEEEKLQEGHSKREEESPDQPTGVGETLEATKTSIEGLQAIAEEAGIGNLPDKVKTILEKLEPLIKVVGAIDALAQQMDPSVRIVWNLCTALFKVAHKQREADRKILTLLDAINFVLDFAKGVDDIEEYLVRFQPTIITLMNEIAQCVILIRGYVGESRIRRAIITLTANLDQKVDDFLESLREIHNRLTSQTVLHTALVSSKIVADVDQLRLNDILKTLKADDRSSASASLCLNGTREAVLQNILDWFLSVEGADEPILWLHGLAGAGKSTIARTVADRIRRIGRCGCFHFFERDKTNGDLVIQTIALQLANSNPIIKSAIADAVDADRNIVTTPLSTQLEQLIEGPLKAASQSLSGPIIIILDSLDEYGDVSARQLLLEFISHRFTALPPHFRILVTSRPELDIRNTFAGNPKIRSMSLRDIDDGIPVVHHYLNHELGRLWSLRRLRRGTTWKVQLDRLAARSEGLFIWASTLVEFLRRSTDPVSQITHVLNKGNTTHGASLDHLYATVLQDLTDWDDGLRKRFRAVMAVVLFCHVPLTEDSIDQLLGLSRKDSSRSIFQRLQCLFDYAPRWPIRALHASFRDYLTDATRSGGKPWTLAGKDFDPYHHLTSCCLELMLAKLHFNMFRFETSSKLNREVFEQRTQAGSSISPSLDYAAKHWMRHLIRVAVLKRDLMHKIRSFLQEKLLFWLEVIAVCSFDYRYSGVLIKFQALITTNLIRDKELQKLFDKAYHFSQRSLPLLQESVPQFYISGLLSQDLHLSLHPIEIPHLERCMIRAGSVDIPLPQPITQVKLPHTGLPIHSIAPTDSGIRVIMAANGGLAMLSCTIVYTGNVQEEGWSANPFAGETGGEMAFSADLTAATYQTNEETSFTQLVGHDSTHTLYIMDTFSSAIHPTRSDIVAVAGLTDSGGAIRICDMMRTECHIHIPAHIHPADPQFCLKWSSDGAYICCIAKMEACIWMVDLEHKSAELKRKIHAHALYPHPTESSLVLTTYKGEVSMCRTDSDSDDYLITRLSEPTRDSVTLSQAKITFSSDGSLIAIWSMTNSPLDIEIVDTTTCQHYQDTITAPGPPINVVFMPDGKKIVAICETISSHLWGFGEEVYIWDIQPGHQHSSRDQFEQANLQGHKDDVSSLSFSPDGSKFLTSSWDGSVHIRSADNGMLLRDHWPLVYKRGVIHAVFSNDGNDIYAALKDGTLNRCSRDRAIYALEDPGPDTYIYGIGPSPSKRIELIIFVVEKGYQRFTLSSEGLLLSKYSIKKASDVPFCIPETGCSIFGYNFDMFTFRKTDPEPRASLGHLFSQAVQMIISPNRKIMILASKSTATLAIWDISRKRMIDTLPVPYIHHTPHVAASYDGSIIAVISINEGISEYVVIQIWRLVGTSYVSQQQHHTLFPWNQYLRVAMSSNGDRLAIASAHGFVLWDVKTSLEEDIVNTSNPRSPSEDTELSIRIATMKMKTHLRCRDGHYCHVKGPSGDLILLLPESRARKVERDERSDLNRILQRFDLHRLPSGNNWVRFFKH